ncbi:MAG: hypothetical protein DHS20C13_28520 [Thermodesulfobacteriota bacterium]|nr:MAG: hypothetical protein DHS20C13_28520 [Thermodesulfobacteriota bacterium]
MPKLSLAYFMKFAGYGYGCYECSEGYVNYNPSDYVPLCFATSDLEITETQTLLIEDCNRYELPDTDIHSLPVCIGCDSKALKEDTGVYTCEDVANCLTVDATDTCTECDSGYHLLADDTCSDLSGPG